MRLAGLALLTLAAMASDARPHDWYSSKRDPIYNSSTCCGGSDCGPIPEHAMTMTPNGLRVRLTLAEAQIINKFRLEPFDEIIPFERIQTSEDGKPHICLMRMNFAPSGDKRQGFFCVFLPPNT